MTKTILVAIWILFIAMPVAAADGVLNVPAPYLTVKSILLGS